MINQRVFEILAELVRIPSPFGNEQRIGSWIFDFLEDMGLNPQTIAVSESGPDVIAEYTIDNNRPFILLNGHMDTVQQTQGWNFDPSGELKENRFYGLGSLDMKAGLALLLAVMEELCTGNIKTKYNVLFTAVSDEELWSRGTMALINQKIITKQKIAYGIVAEPQGVPNLVIGRRGRVVFDIRITGKAAHAAIPENGVNAIVEACKIIQHLPQLPLGFLPEFNISGSQCILAFHAESQGLTVPESAKLILDRHYLPSESYQAVIEAFQQFISSIAVSSLCRVEVTQSSRPTPPPPSFCTQLSNSLVQRAKECLEEEFATACQCKIANSVADGNFIGSLGIPVIDFGPSGNNEHHADEWVDITTLDPFFRIYKQLLTQL